MDANAVARERGRKARTDPACTVLGKLYNLPLVSLSGKCSLLSTLSPPFSLSRQVLPAAQRLLPGEHFEVRQTSATDDYKLDPSKSIKLSPARQALLDDIISLYSCQPTRRPVERYTPDCVYDDQLVYANDSYKMAGQWFALPSCSTRNEPVRAFVQCLCPLTSILLRSVCMCSACIVENGPMDEQD
ncbi:hypothetical protein K466DRAFT_604806 [Polyporus arcularius HHB13444]|uniref:Uncharacterized protein n=1 Tax=Polyporus arcularius HHB13444 TaxID=1314778 RepID=A0A5C3NVK2_9APHY|nr:hypothetical protein K466DRAFT_604806 [Polyporus arcularius HHB13444]